MNKHDNPRGRPRDLQRKLLRHQMIDFTPSATFIIVLVALSVLIVFLSAIIGCGTTPQAVDHADAWLNAATNTIEGLKTYLAPVVPAPFTSVATGLLTVVSAGLVAWNTHQHGQIRTLQNGKHHDLPLAPTPQKT